MTDTDSGRMRNASTVFTKYFDKANSVVSERSVFTGFVMAVTGAVLALTGALPWYLRTAAFFFLFVIAYLGFAVTQSLRTPYIRFSRKAEEIMIIEFNLLSYCRYFPSDFKKYCDTQTVSKERKQEIEKRLAGKNEADSHRNSMQQNSGETTKMYSEWKPMSVTTVFLLFFAIIGILGLSLSLISIAEGIGFTTLQVETRFLFIIISVIFIVVWSSFLTRGAIKMKENERNMTIQHVNRILNALDLPK